MDSAVANHGKARRQLVVRIESRLMPKVALEASTDLADFLVERPMTAATGDTYIAHLRAFYGWAKSEGHSTSTPRPA